MTKTKEKKFDSHDTTIVFTEGNHRYRHKERGKDGKYRYIPSVTTIVGQLDKGQFLSEWYGKKTHEAIINHLRTKIKDGGEGEVSLGEALEEIEGMDFHKAGTKERDAAAEEGTRIHKDIEEYVKLKMHHNPFVSKEEKEEFEKKILEFSEKPHIQKFMGWESEYRPKYIAVEEIVYFPKVKGGYPADVEYCGQADIIAEIDGETFTIDIKTSSAIYPSHKIQVAAYGFTHNVFRENVMILRIPRAKDTDTVEDSKDIEVWKPAKEECENLVSLFVYLSHVYRLKKEMKL